MKKVGLLPKIKLENDFGILEQEYIKDGFTVKIYSHDMTESQRIKTNIQIRERVIEIVLGGELCKQSM